MRSLRLIVPALALTGLFVSPAAWGQCEYRRQVHVERDDWRSNDGHKTGSHRAVLVSEFTCICDHTCRSNSKVVLKTISCIDSGRIKGLMTHRIYKNSTVDRESIPLATGDKGASAAAAMACYVEECYPFQCKGISISVKGSPLDVGLGAVFAASRRPFDKHALKVELDCDPCWRSRQVTEDLRRTGQEYVPVDEGGYGTPGVSVYRSCQWECESHMGSDGTYYEVCSLKDCLIF